MKERIETIKPSRPRNINGYVGMQALGLGSLLPSDPFKEVLVGSVLLGYAFGVVFATKYVYGFMTGKGLQHNVAVYYNRKLIHVFAGGVVALLVPFFFSSPIIPFAVAMVLALATWVPHKTGKLMEWFQVTENSYEVNFCLMWGVSLLISWVLLGDPIYALVPILFMAFGDAATGFTRNLIFRRRTKSWWGNIAMFLVTAPIGYLLLGPWGVGVAAASSLIEHFEFNPVDDNILISVVALIGTLLVKVYA